MLIEVIAYSTLAFGALSLLFLLLLSLLLFDFWRVTSLTSFHPRLTSVLGIFFHLRISFYLPCPCPCPCLCLSFQICRSVLLLAASQYHPWLSGVRIPSREGMDSQRLLPTYYHYYSRQLFTSTKVLIPCSWRPSSRTSRSH